MECPHKYFQLIDGKLVCIQCGGSPEEPRPLLENKIMTVPENKMESVPEKKDTFRTDAGWTPETTRIPRREVRRTGKTKTKPKKKK